MRLWAALLLTLAVVSAPSERGNVTGIVTDPAGAAVAGAELSIVNRDTNATVRFRHPEVVRRLSPVLVDRMCIVMTYDAGMSSSSFARIACVALLGTALLQNVAAAADAADILPDESLKGWTRIPIPPVDGLKPKLQWRVDAAQKALICTGDGGHEWLRYDKELGDFVLDVDWRYTPKTDEPKRYNSGIGVRLSQYGELWVQAQAGLSGYLFGTNFADGAIKRFNLSKDAKANPIKPAGEWNHYQVRVQGDRITLTINATPVSEVSGIGLRRGYIGLEAEGYEITFRNVKLASLD